MAQALLAGADVLKCVYTISGWECNIMFSQQMAQALCIIFAQQMAQVLLAGADVLKCVYT